MPNPEGMKSDQVDNNNNSNILETVEHVENLTAEANVPQAEKLKDLTEVQEQNREIMTKLDEKYPHAFYRGACKDSGISYLITKPDKYIGPNGGKWTGEPKIISQEGVITVGNSSQWMDDLRGGDYEISGFHISGKITPEYNSSIKPDENKFFAGIEIVSKKDPDYENSLGAKYIENFVDTDLGALKEQFSRIEAAHINDIEEDISPLKIRTTTEILDAL